MSHLTGFMMLIIDSQCSVNWKISFEFCKRKDNFTVQGVLMKKVILMKTFPDKKLMIVNCTRICMENQIINFRRTKMKP